MTATPSLTSTRMSSKRAMRTAVWSGRDGRRAAGRVGADAGRPGAAARVPLIMLLEGAGYRATDRAHGRGPTDLVVQARCSGLVPVATAVLGASAGHGALVAPMSDFAVMTETAQIFTAGPPVVKESTGEDVTKEELGGPAVAVASGLVHNVAPDDRAALDQLRAYLSYFPS